MCQWSFLPLWRGLDCNELSLLRRWRASRARSPPGPRALIRVFFSIVCLERTHQRPQHPLTANQTGNWLPGTGFSLANRLQHRERGGDGLHLLFLT